jgi:chromosome segregation protein
MGSVRLASLTLEGFKSFAGRAELSFPGAIIAIIGPNGAGKSNVSDAISWVLGEQSARLLRSQNMADVIFAGAPNRSALGAAQVTLTLVAPDGRWPETEGRLAISRRVMRDGTSEFRLRGKRVRLKDIMDELMDAGLGTRSYAIIEQGRIGQVLSVRATERRALFEEAAGITKFRARRHEAELKLAETSANLLRLADIASEVRRALEAARRQARRAEKHLELRQGLAVVRGALFAGKRALLLADVAARQSAVSEVEIADAEAVAALASAEAELEARRRDLDLAQERLVAAREQEASADALAQRREAEEAAARREAAEADERSRGAQLEAQRLASAGQALAEQAGALSATLAAAEAALTEADRHAAEEGQRADAVEGEARAASASAEEARRALLVAVAGATDARNRVHRLEVEAEQLGYQRTRLGAERERLAVHLGETAAKEDEAASHERAATARATEAEQARQTLRARQEVETARVAELSTARDRAGHERWQAQHELEGLRRALAGARALPGSLARALSAEAVLGTVADFLAPTPDVARSLDQVYGDLLRTPVVADEAGASALASRSDRGEGRLEVVVADRSRPARSSPLLERSGAQADDLGWLSAALPRAEIAGDAENALELAHRDPDLLVLLPDGGRRRGGWIELPGSRPAAPGIMELRGREQVVAAAEREAAEREAAREAELGAAQRASASLAAELMGQDEVARQAAESQAAASSTHEALHRERERLEREAEALEAELVRLEAEGKLLVDRLAVARAEVERLGARTGAVETEVDALAREAERCRQASSLARTEAERARGAVALAHERLAAARREVERHAAEMAGLTERERLARGETTAQTARAEAAVRAAAAARADLEELLARRAVSHREVEELTGVVEVTRAEVGAAASEAEERRGAHLAARDAAYAARLALTEARGARDRLDEAIALTLGAQAELPPPPEAAQVPALEDREQRLAAELEAMGPVNELALAEREELEQRHKFLTTQRRDLERALESLNGTVKELDTTCAERFLATLEEANASFENVFQRLFGGGEARAELSDPEAPLESGIEIRVRPPGKHTQSVLLLSGGEKALAAIALLLGLFRIRPAPFCLLDEVDAPLDDANVERLADLLREMSGETQFLLITHNRRTMARADVLYGVTMEEPGVSRIVSVRLEE